MGRAPPTQSRSNLCIAEPEPTVCIRAHRRMYAPVIGQTVGVRTDTPSAL